ncbi:TolC family protein [Pontibacter indicus]|uniref:Outer membrane protein, cobalt-zinc-cadmium efflux system n=1 Tax=Pontibacter indicus TaxID=1317125 RepID=A0A1R3X2B3_9BACT|nr:TolC family protein [Pontibacter indicus]SIT84337.1 outer membrane protein, cobalt-zinc-cadmium efflux system [Pontibacter indicus]
MTIKFLKHVIWLLLLVPFCLTQAQAQTPDTLALSRVEAEALFLEKNLAQIAERLSIDQAEALILQAKAWPNPELEISEVNFWATPHQIANGDGNPPLFRNGFGENRQFAVQLEQLVFTARKRKKNISLQVANRELAQTAYTEMLLSLKAEFRTMLSELHYQQRHLQLLQRQQQVVSQLVRAQEAQLRNGNISKADFYRIRALDLSLRAELNEALQESSRAQKELKTLMLLPPATTLYLTDSEPLPHQSLLQDQSLDSLLTLAARLNPAVRVAETDIRVSEAAHTLERALRVPDLRFNANYDRGGNILLNFVGFGVAMDLPFFDRNKGNIKAAEMQVQQSRHLHTLRVNEAQNEVVKTFQDYRQLSELYQSIDATYINELDEVLAGVSRNFQRKNISLLEFLDFFEAFKENKLLYFDTLRSLESKKEELNLLTGTDL